MAPPSSDDQSTLIHARFDPTEAQSSFSIRVIEGPDAGAELALGGEGLTRALVGVGPASDLRLTDRTVSRRHVALEIEGERLRLTDLSSTNETTVDGVVLLDGYVKEGARILLGATVLAVERRAAEPAKLPPTKSFGRLIGASTEMRRLHPLCERLAATTIPLIIEGETGTGKEVLARALHEQGPRAAHPFVVFDCTTVPANLVESELFGHERGAFTGATAPREGLFAEAHGGTLLVDEIGDLDVGLQAKLLRVLDSGEFRRVGDNAYHRADVRVIAATRRDLDREIQAGRFRDDLYHRLAVGRIELPPLRRRRGDVWVLARHFAAELDSNPDELPVQLLARWERDPWPGNVRELKNAVARHIVLGGLSLEPAADAPETGARDAIAEVLALGLPLKDTRERLMDEISRRYLRKVLEETGGNVTQAARSSGVSRRYLQSLKAKLGE
ncbi:MAG: sigma 54-dependent Fis family transcriptional regulator [Deltaproteobacteria bacterium]|jgi:DNA-binding NtrC family response regulator|nr:sigma 54-dependent Fis family transcriptional regulator [Deltaproteobacteria bacterium]MBW2532778.1 sigma 54-dependent Fis family transcriptional regulator [Deltaproteobacteria bacterium]